VEKSVVRAGRECVYLLMGKFDEEKTKKSDFGKVAIKDLLNTPSSEDASKIKAEPEKPGHDRRLSPLSPGVRRLEDDASSPNPSTQGYDRTWKRPRSLSYAETESNVEVGRSVTEGEIQRDSEGRRDVWGSPSICCHICARRTKSLRLLICANFQIQRCRKAICEQCAAAANGGVLPDEKWSCPHCRDCCPPHSNCFKYNKYNSGRKRRQQ